MLSRKMYEHVGRLVFLLALGRQPGDRNSGRPPTVHRRPYDAHLIAIPDLSDYIQIVHSTLWRDVFNIEYAGGCKKVPEKMKKGVPPPV
jgi:hypothetical protein